MRTNHPFSISRIGAVVVVLAATLIGGAVPLLFQGLAITAHVVEPSVQVQDGQRTAMVRWQSPDGPRSRRIVIPAEHANASQVRIVRDGNGYRIAGPTTADWWVAAIAALIGAAFGAVVVASLAGYGYVRGRGEHGTMTERDLREDRGFYWRS